MAQKVELEDFSGGITDYYLSAPPNKLKQCDNLLINQYQGQGKVFTRPGSELYDILAPRPVANRITTCFNYKDTLYVQSATKLYYYKASTHTWEEIAGRSGHDAFPLSTPSHQFTYANWNYHTFIANSSLPGYPMKVTKSGNTLTLRQAGLPKYDSTAVTLNYAPGSNNYLYKIAYRRSYTAGETGSNQFLDISTPSPAILASNCISIGPANSVTLNNLRKLVYQAFNCVAGQVYEIRNPIDTDFTLIGAPNNNIGTVFTATGPGSGSGEVYKLLNNNETNWDDENIEIDVYRTKNNGTVYYLVATLTSSAVGYIDTKTDANLEAGEQLYTNSGVPGNDPPPKCKSIHVRNDIAYYGNIEGQSYRFLQSIPGDIDSVPESFYVDIDDDIVAVSSTKNNVIILSKQKVYRADGFYDELGRNGILVERISDTGGCIGTNTAVQALDGVFWLGKDAVYFTDGFKVIKLNQDYDETYKTFTSDDTKNLKYQGKYDSKKNRIWWTIQDEDASDLNKCYVLDLNWAIRENSTFTTISGDNFVPSAIEFINGDMIRCSDIGYVLIHKDTLYVDPVINSSIPVTDWINETIVYTLETAAYNFGTSAVRKYVTQANVTCESTTNLSLQIVSNNDDNRIIANLLPIRYRGNIFWREPDVYWGDATLDWNKQGLIHEKRLMPAKSLRCNYKSLKFTNAHVAILSSDVIGTVTVNSTLKTATLTDIVKYDWPSKAIGYYISFETDNYTKEYKISNRTDDVLVYTDTLDTSVSGSNLKWVIRGKPQGEILNLLNLSIVYDIAGQSQGAYKVSGSGEVGTIS